MSERGPIIERFLAAHGWGKAEVRLLAADASFRRYLRIVGETDTAVLMDAPPPRENVAAFVAVTSLLNQLGFSAPQPRAEDLGAGLLLLEDFGDRTYTRALIEGADELQLYERAVDLLLELHGRWPKLAANTPALPPYDAARLLEEASLLVDWYLPAIEGEPPSAKRRQEYLEAWRAVLPQAARLTPTLVLRDYHVDNLMVLEARQGVAACGLLDFQDAVIGDPSYDLVSLLQDARRDLKPGLEAAMLCRYLDSAHGLDPEAFLDAYSILGAQRSAKIAGIFTRLHRRDGKAQYLRHIPRVLRLLEAGLKQPGLEPVADWFARELPAEARVPPPLEPVR
ncbi:MAG: aminoglycoside phosphotransferase family protein [Kiloniellales bacterium]